jgi:6-pyruvoyl-tetrahydropterin synthase
MEQSIIVRHNVEMGHRLSQQPDSKCFHLHGHSWWVELEIIGEVSPLGMVGNLNFGDVKKIWRGYLDEKFDHHLCLNEFDPLVFDVIGGELARQWGIVTVPFDPTVENMARHWGSWAQRQFGDNFKFRIRVQEAATNAATWRSY